MKNKVLLGMSLLSAALLLQPSGANAGTAQAVQIGVLAYKGVDGMQEDWSYVANWLDAAIPGQRFTLLNFDQAALTRAVQERSIDFLITSSGHYVALEHSDGASRIATIESPWALSPGRSIGSAIVVRGDGPLHALTDLAGKHVLAVDADAFGGYQIAKRELLEAGVNPEQDFASLQFAGFPMQNIVQAVRAGQADAGIIRICMLEQMMRSGEIGAAELRVLSPIAIPGLPCQTSSRLYPDWPIAVLPHTPAQLSKQVAIALLRMPRSANGDSWAVPADYQAVDALFRELKIGPYAYLDQWTLEAVLRRYWGWLLLILALLVLWSVHTVRVEYLVRAAQERQRRMADEARLLQSRLDHTARLAILGEMASAIAHELNQPLAAIANFARGMARRITADRLEPLPLLNGTNEIVAQSERAANIIRNIRAFARKKASERTSVNLIAVVGDAIELFVATHPQACIIWQPGTAKGSAHVMADPLHIQQVTLNLLKNALDAQYTAGVANEAIEVHFRAEEDVLLISVQDCGCGLASNEFASLFEPFFTTKPEGLGLGLSLSKGMIESLGGTLAAVANEGKAGLTVWFSLPKEITPGAP